MSSLGVQQGLRHYYLSVIHISFPSNSEKLWVESGLALHFWAGMLFQDQQNNMFIIIYLAWHNPGDFHWLLMSDVIDRY